MKSVITDGTPSLKDKNVEVIKKIFENYLDYLLASIV